MPQVDANRLKCNYATAVVAARLAPHCLIRPVAADTDVGIDLYCESVEGETPFLHFWLQVRSGRQCKVLKNGKASCAFERRHLDYWRKQPVPVFAALVPIEKWPAPAGEELTVYIVDLSTLIGKYSSF